LRLWPVIDYTGVEAGTVWTNAREMR
jgi:hypothetical protein